MNKFHRYKFSIQVVGWNMKHLNNKVGLEIPPFLRFCSFYSPKFESKLARLSSIPATTHPQHMSTNRPSLRKPVPVVVFPGPCRLLLRLRRKDFVVNRLLCRLSMAKWDDCSIVARNLHFLSLASPTPPPRPPLDSLNSGTLVKRRSLLSKGWRRRFVLNSLRYAATLWTTTTCHFHRNSCKGTRRIRWSIDCESNGDLIVTGSGQFVDLRRDWDGNWQIPNALNQRRPGNEKCGGGEGVEWNGNVMDMKGWIMEKGSAAIDKLCFQ